jgi:hypothetical protein
MRTKPLFIIIASFVGTTLSGQDQSSRQPLPEPAYVRRFSMGLTLSTKVLALVPERQSTTFTDSPPLEERHATEGLSHRVGYGVSAQLALTERFALHAGALMRRVGYKMRSDWFAGVDNPATIVDERRHTLRQEDTRARFYDVPVLIRYYGTDRHDPGARWFVQFGGTMRRVSRIKTSIDRTTNPDDPQCCETTPATPSKQSLPGVAAGFGGQFIDHVGIRVTPEVRYTRWLGTSFSSFTTGTRRDQVEILLSIGF